MPAISTTTTRAEKTPAKKKPKVKAPAQPKAVKVRPPTRPDAAEETRTRPPRKVSVPKAGDAPQARKADTAKADRYKQTDAYVQKVQKAREANLAQHPEQRPKDKSIYGGFGLKRYGPHDARKEIDFQETNFPKAPGATDRPRTDEEIKRFLKNGQRPVRGETTLSQARKAQAIKVAPVLKVLDQTTRPLHAVAGAADAAVTHKDVLHAAKRGIQNKDKTMFSDVLEHAGVKNKAVKSAVGFGLDVALDPTTYVTFGTGGVLKKGALQAAKGADKTTAKGVTVKVAGKEVPGVRSATAKAGVAGGKATRKVVPAKVRDTARNVISEVNPAVAPAGVAKEAHQAARKITRNARAATTKGEREAINLGHAIKTQIGAKNYNRVVDAIEAGDLTTLPPGLVKHAAAVRDHLDAILKKQRAVGLKVGEVKHRPQIQVPHVTANPAATAKARSAAHRAEEAARKKVEDARAAHDVHQGRAEILSRNVSGTDAEKAAERGRRKRKARIAPKYAGGGHGVNTTAQTLRDAERAHEAATAARVAADAAHAAEKTTAAEQRAALAKVEKVNAKRAIAVKGYVPRKLTADAIEAENKKQARVGGTSTASPGSSKARIETRPMAVVRAEKPGRYREDLHATVAERMAEGTASVARATLAKELAGLGRSVTRGSRPHLTEHEAVYKLRDGKLTEVDVNSKAFRKKPPEGKALKSQYVVLNRKLYDRTMGNGGRPDSGTIMAGYDRTQANFKRIALATPGFHIRNAIGDTAQAYVHQPGQKLAGNMVRAGRVLKAVGRDEKAQRKLVPGGQAATSKGTLKTKKYGHVSYEEAARHLVAAGAARSGYTARELRDLGQSGKSKLRLPKSPGGVRRAFLNREDLPRLATAIHAVREGATWEEAAARVSDVHFDYGDLTPFERNIARRIMPFYTWSARNIPLQSKRIITNPGKYANYQKVREEAGALSEPGQLDPKTQGLYKQLEAAGVKLDGGWEKYLTEYEKRNAGVPVSWKGQKYTLSAGLPLGDLNELPGLSGPGEYLNKAASLVSPVIKDPVEFGFNYSFFFRDQIERDNSPLVAAPSPVGAWPEWAKKKFGVVKAQDKRSGKMVWQWPGKADYVAHAVPGLPSQIVKALTPGHDRQGKGAGAKALGALGIKAAPIDATTNAINMAYERQSVIDKKQSVLRRQNNPANGQLISAKNPTPEYTRLSAQRKVALQIAYQGKAQRKDAVLPKQGGPPKVRVRSGTVKLSSQTTGRVKLGGVSTGRVRLGG